MSSAPVNRLKRLAAIVEFSEDAIYGMDMDGIISEWNNGAEQLYGYTADEVIGKPISLLIPPDHSDEFPTIMQKMRRGESVAHYETVRQKKDGTRVDVDLSASPIRDETGRIIGAAAIARDISDRNKRYKGALRESEEALEEGARQLHSQEELLKIFVKNVPAGVAMFDREMRYLQVSDRWCADYSIDSSQMLGRSHYDIVPDMPEHWKEAHRRGLEGEILQADQERWDRKGGTLWVRWEIRPWRTSNGIIGGILIFAEDVTDRKQMHDALHTMSRKLIDSQEQERMRIGRELHDDVSQRLALLAIALEQLERNPSKIQSRLRKLREEAFEISDDVEALSHELHSSKLQYLGVVAGIKSWCKEFGERQNMVIDLRTDVATVLQWEIGICLFRVLQEALHNAIKYSGVKRVDVRLMEEPNQVHLIVSDSGKGFDVDSAMQGKGLGLTSMRERVRSVNGTIEIESKPMGGTAIEVRVPLESQPASQRAS